MGLGHLVINPGCLIMVFPYPFVTSPSGGLLIIPEYLLYSSITYNLIDPPSSPSSYIDIPCEH